MSPATRFTSSIGAGAPLVSHRAAPLAGPVVRDRARHSRHRGGARREHRSGAQGRWTRLSTTPRPRRGSIREPGFALRPPPRPTAAAVATDPGQVGQWGPVVDWPVVGIHVALLPNGKVLAWDSVGDAATETFPVQDHTRATVYDPVDWHAHAGQCRHGLQHLLLWLRPPERRFAVHRRRQQGPAAQRDRPDASLQPGDQHLAPRARTWPPAGGIRRLPR